MSKQDRQGARTVSDLERKYNLHNYGEQFAIVMGVATDARKATAELEERLNSEIAAVRTEIKESQDGILLRAEFEAYQETVIAELALKYGKDDNEEIISLIEACADEIRLSASALVVESEFFTLTESGVASLTSALMDYAQISESDITQCDIYDADITLGTITSADIVLGTIEDAEIKRGTIEEAEIKLGSIDEAEIAKCRISESYIGNVYFDKFTSTTDIQMSFTDYGIFLTEQQPNAGNRRCFVWQNNDGTDMFRIRGYSDGLHFEGVEYDDNQLDLVVFGISIRDMYEKIGDLEERIKEAEDDCTHKNKTTYTDSTDTQCYWRFVEKCDDCGTVIRTWYDYEHDFMQGECTNCGAIDPDYEYDCTTNGHDYGSDGYCIYCGEYSANDDETNGDCPEGGNHDYSYFGREEDADGSFIDIYECNKCGDMYGIHV